jgi:hypothetical protein
MLTARVLGGLDLTWGTPALIRASLSNTRVIMAVMCVFMVKPLCEAMTGQTPVLECVL